ncbi:hypothetical protein AAHE18_09G011600 [Arachis hypogaea]|nr:uncharacterized protein DS421_9g254520 [Arachis hypogaea]
MFLSPATTEEILKIENNHIILVVGCESKIIHGRREEYFIIKNSWRSSWADGGYGKISVNRIECGRKLKAKDLSSRPTTVKDFTFTANYRNNVVILYSKNLNCSNWIKVHPM